MITSDNFKEKLYNSKKTLDFHTISTLQYCIKLPVVFTFAWFYLRKTEKASVRVQSYSPQSVLLWYGIVLSSRKLVSGAREL